SQDLLEEYIEKGDTGGLTGLLRSDPSLATKKTCHQVSPLMLCCYFKKPELATIIAEYIPQISSFEASALGRKDIVEQAVESEPELLLKFSEDGFTLLGLASYFGHEDIVRYLLLKGSDPNIPSNNGYQV